MAWAGENGNERFMKMCKHQEKGYQILPPNVVQVVFCPGLVLITHKQPISLLRNAIGKKLDVHLSGVQELLGKQVWNLSNKFMIFMIENTW